MDKVVDNPLVQFFLTVLAIMGGILLIKIGVGHLPDSNTVFTSVKSAVGMV